MSIVIALLIMILMILIVLAIGPEMILFLLALGPEDGCFLILGCLGLAAIAVTVLGLLALWASA